jgi:hypothetical protein
MLQLLSWFDSFNFLTDLICNEIVFRIFGFEAIRSSKLH